MIDSSPLRVTGLTDGEGPGETLATLLSYRLREDILNGNFQPGAKLNLGELKGAFGVSLSPLREALSRLCTDGLVELEDNKGYRTSGISEESLTEITRLRLARGPGTGRGHAPRGREVGSRAGGGVFLPQQGR